MDVIKLVTYAKKRLVHLKHIPHFLYIMNNINRLLIPFILLLLGLLLTSCQQDSAQQQYEAEATVQSKAIHKPIYNRMYFQDKKDWQVSPYHQGLIPNTSSFSESHKLWWNSIFRNDTQWCSNSVVC